MALRLNKLCGLVRKSMRLPKRNSSRSIGSAAQRQLSGESTLGVETDSGRVSANSKHISKQAVREHSEKPCAENRLTDRVWLPQ